MSVSTDAILDDAAPLDQRPASAPDPRVTAGLAAIRRSAGSAEGRSYSSVAGLSERHFRRLFKQQVGMSPKRYARIVRLEAAMKAKERAPERNWTDIAHRFGWFDQAHMDRDFRALTGVTPSRYQPSGA